MKSRELSAGPVSWQESQMMRVHQWTARRILEAVA